MLREWLSIIICDNLAVAYRHKVLVTLNNILKNNNNMTFKRS